MNEQQFDELLNIKTTGEQKGFMTSLHYHRYEPTPYSALELFFNEYTMSRNDHSSRLWMWKRAIEFLSELSVQYQCHRS